jgi:four helix bundle protein
MGTRSGKRTYDLRERLAQFAEAIIRLAKTIPDVTANRPLIRQIVAAGTSVGANYEEADNAASDRDFCHKMSICRKEASETRYWLRMLAAAEPECAAEARRLYREADEFSRIFSKIVNDMQRRLQDEQKRTEPAT